jgi:hypothetical protein
LVAARTVRRNPTADSEPESTPKKPICGSGNVGVPFLGAACVPARSSITLHGEMRRAGRAPASNLFFEHDCRFSDSPIDDRRRPGQFGQDYFFSSMFQNVHLLATRRVFSTRRAGAQFYLR